MAEPNPLAAHTMPAESGAAFCATREGGLAFLAPLTERARLWLHEHASEEATWIADSLVVEMRYFPDMADAIIAAGFAFERDPYPN